uniref:Uncharacterized protein n=1 Tax=Candidatus Kentrum sp. DK TaxID=2126562 RepID=A0A450T4G1_9GAMM|nr:MAG: hypothetical protein BECKDK2373B_GA0170837_110115 [Candidatus Kentron sp. DK]
METTVDKTGAAAVDCKFSNSFLRRTDSQCLIPLAFGFDMQGRSG